MLNLIRRFTCEVPKLYRIFVVQVQYQQQVIYMKLSKLAIDKISKSYKAIGALADELDKHPDTIKNMLNPEHTYHELLTLPRALAVICTETKLSESDVLETEKTA